MIMVKRKKPRGEGSPARFAPGELVRHRRYGYRGVVVDFDLACTAPDKWYESNKTQPRREQPWYHVLVDGSFHATYAAEENLVVDDSYQAINHPLIPQFFEAFQDGHYVRNDRPWGTESS